MNCIRRRGLIEGARRHQGADATRERCERATVILAGLTRKSEEGEENEGIQDKPPPRYLERTSGVVPVFRNEGHDPEDRGVLALSVVPVYPRLHTQLRILDHIIHA